jgi:hypothetical protein
MTCDCRYAADWMNYWWGYELVHTWMLTGKFTWKVPVLGQWLPVVMNHDPEVNNILIGMLTA